MNKAFLLLPLLSGAILYAQPTRQYSHGEPTNDEQHMLELINRARANPNAEGQRLVNTDDPDVLSAVEFFNVNLRAVTQAFNTYSAVPPLAFHPDLIEAARGHSQSMISGDKQTHQFIDGPSLRDRTNAAGYSEQTSLRENVYAYMENTWEGHAAFQIDWTFVTETTPDGIQNPPGHRITIMDATEPEDPFTEIGIGILVDTLDTEQNLLEPPEGVIGPLVVTQDFGRPVNPTYYIVGVAYIDSDEDGFYTQGEGLSGVTITPSKGDWFAVTSQSGGYAIPLENVTGPVNVTASGGSLAENIVVSFNFDNANEKVDFVVESETASDPDPDPNPDPVEPIVQNPAVDFSSDLSVFDDFLQSGWFGGFFDLSQQGASPGWLYHLEHASIFYIGDENGLWLYSTSLGWSYTSMDLYPNIFSTEIGWIFYYKPAEGEESTRRVFFDYTRSQNFFNDPSIDDLLIYF